MVNDGISVATGAIVEYLVNKYGPQLKPATADEDASLAYNYWLHFAEGDLPSSFAASSPEM